MKWIIDNLQEAYDNRVKEIAESTQEEKHVNYLRGVNDQLFTAISILRFHLGKESKIFPVLEFLKWEKSDIPPEAIGDYICLCEKREKSKLYQTFKIRAASEKKQNEPLVFNKLIDKGWKIVSYRKEKLTTAEISFKNEIDK